MKIPALSLQEPERQGQGTLVSKIRKKGWASPLKPLAARTIARSEMMQQARPSAQALS